MKHLDLIPQISEPELTPEQLLARCAYCRWPLLDEYGEPNGSDKALVLFFPDRTTRAVAHRQIELFEGLLHEYFTQIASCNYNPSANDRKLKSLYSKLRSEEHPAAQEGGFAAFMRKLSLVVPPEIKVCILEGEELQDFEKKYLAMIQCPLDLLPEATQAMYREAQETLNSIKAATGGGEYLLKSTLDLQDKNAQEIWKHDYLLGGYFLAPDGSILDPYDEDGAPCMDGERELSDIYRNDPQMQEAYKLLPAHEIVNERCIDTKVWDMIIQIFRDQSRLLQSAERAR